MRYVPVQDAVRRWRVYLQMTVPALVRATRSRVSERTIRQLESGKPQKYLQFATVGELAKAFSRQGKPCRPEYLAWHVRRDGTIQPAPSPDPTLDGAPAPEPPADLLGEPAVTASTARKAEKKQSPPAVDVPAVEPSEAGETLSRAFTRQVARERAMGRHADTVTLGDASYPLVGLQLLQEIEQVYMEKEGQLFVIAGQVVEQRAIPDKAAAELGAELGRGAGYYLVAREVQGRTDDGDAQRLTVYPTVYAPLGAHGKLLTRCWSEKLPVTVLAKLVTTKPRAGVGEERWVGFFGLEPGKKKPRAWAFVAVDVLVEEPKSDIPKKRSSGKAPVFAPGGIRIR